MNDFRLYAPMVLRMGLSLVFLWFGFNQLFFPEMFLGYVPAVVTMPMQHFMEQHHPSLARSVEQTNQGLVFFNAVLELVFGLLLLLGLFTRIVAVVLLVHLLSIAFFLGYNDVMIRDLGLSIALLSVALYGHDSWCLETKLKK